MRKTLLAKSFAEINAAKRALSRLEKAPSFEVAAEAWNEGISAVAKAWNKAAAEYKNTPTFPVWNSKWEEILKTDFLLQYVRQARNADEHTIQDSLQSNPGGVAINSATPGGALYIKKMEFSGGRIKLDTGGMPFSVKMILPHPELIAFTNRGVKYEPPNQHKCNNINGKILWWCWNSQYASTKTICRSFVPKCHCKHNWPIGNWT